MAQQASKSVALDRIDADAPMFDPKAFRLGEEEAEIIARARKLGQTVFASRAAAYDRDAKFPTENYQDLHRAGLLGIAMKALPVGTAYAVWVGVGAVGTVVLGIVLLGEPANAGRLVSIALIVAGIVGLKLASPG